MAEGLKKVLYFLGILNDQDLEWLIGAGKKRSVPARTQLIRAGERTDYLYFILSGEFSVVAGQTEIARIAPGEILGEISFVDSRPPTATVTAVTDSMVGAIPCEALETKLDWDKAFASRFYKSIGMALADRLRSVLAQEFRTKTGTRQDDEAEVSPELLDSMAMAGNRFAEMQRRPWGGA